MINLGSNLFIYFLSLICFPALVIRSMNFTGDRSDDYFLGKSQTDVIKGASILLIFFAHFAKRMENPGLLNLFFSLTAFLGVALFFFFSGYGLTASFSKKENYLDDFLKTKVFKIYAISVIANLIIGIIGIVANYGNLSISSVIMDAILIRLPTSDAFVWYVVATLVMYFFFYVSFSFLKKKKAVALLFGLTLIYVVVGEEIGLGNYWLNAVFSFPLGSLIYLKKNSFSSFVDRNYFKTLFSTGFLFLITFVSGYLLRNSVYNISLYMHILSTLSFILLVITVTRRFKLDSKILTYFSNISYELFLIHSGLFDIYASKNHGSNITMLLLFGGTILLSHAFYLVNTKIFSKKKKPVGGKVTKTAN